MKIENKTCAYCNEPIRWWQQNREYWMEFEHKTVLVHRPMCSVLMYEKERFIEGKAKQREIYHRNGLDEYGVCKMGQD